MTITMPLRLFLKLSKDESFARSNSPEVVANSLVFPAMITQLGEKASKGSSLSIVSLALEGKELIVFALLLVNELSFNAVARLLIVVD